MTSKERARGVVHHWYEGTDIDEDTKNSMARVIERAIDAAVDEAVAAERESCAKVADSNGAVATSKATKNVAYFIAEEIRARGAK
jgi:hypothetical protein